MKRYIWIVVLLVGLMACQQASEPVAQSGIGEEVVVAATIVVETAIPTATPIPATPLPTETAVPPTETAIPATPTPTEAAPTPIPTKTAVPEPDIIYMAYFGGGPAGQWDKANYDTYRDMHPELNFKRVRGDLYTQPVPREIHDDIASNLNPPDIASSYIVGNIRAYVGQGLIRDISDVWQEEGWDEIFPPSLKRYVTLDGKQYFVPQAYQWNPIFYRTDIFAEQGMAPPETWDELLATCDALHAAGYIPFAVSVTDWTPPMARWFTYLNLRLNGPEYHESLMAGNESYDDPRIRAVFEQWRELFAHNCFSDDYQGYGAAVRQLFEGDAVMYLLGEWLAESAPNRVMPETIDFFRFPIIDPDVPLGEIVHVYGAYVLNDARDSETAVDMLKYLASTESQTSNAEAIGRMVSNMQVDQALYTNMYLRGREFVADAEHITQLFEFNTHPIMARVGLTVFGRFWRDPTLDLDPLLEELENARIQAYEE